MYCYVLVYTSTIHIVFWCWGDGVCAAGNSTPTIPHKFSKHRSSLFPMGCADTAASDGRCGSNVYEVNTWLWNFGCGKPRLGGLTVEATTIRKKTGRKDQARRSALTRRRRREDGAWSSEVCCFLKYIPVCTSLYQYVPVCTLKVLNLISFENHHCHIVSNA